MKVVEGGSIQDSWIFENFIPVDLTQLSDVKFIVGSFLKNLFSYLFSFLIYKQFSKGRYSMFFRLHGCVVFDKFSVDVFGDFGFAEAKWS